jgi:biotin operon repressor
MRTTHKTRFVPFQTGKSKISVKVKAGQFIFGRNKAADFLGDSPSTIWKRMKKLEEIGNISINSSNKQYSIVTICNWSEYQQDQD